MFPIFQILRKLKNFEADQPHTHAMFYMSYLLSEHAWDKFEILDSLKCKLSCSCLPKSLYFEL